MADAAPPIRCAGFSLTARRPAPSTTIEHWTASGPDGLGEVYLGPPVLLARAASIPVWGPFPDLESGRLADGRAFVAIPGSLSTDLEELAQRLSPGAAAAFGWHIANALAEVHERGGAHGALHPAFIGLDARGRLSIRPAFAATLPADPDPAATAQATDCLQFGHLLDVLGVERLDDPGLPLLRSGLHKERARFRIAPGRAVRQAMSALLARHADWEAALVESFGVEWRQNNALRMPPRPVPNPEVAPVRIPAASGPESSRVLAVAIPNGATTGRSAGTVAVPNAQPLRPAIGGSPSQIFARGDGLRVQLGAGVPSSYDDDEDDDEALIAPQSRSLRTPVPAALPAAAAREASTPISRAPAPRPVPVDGPTLRQAPVLPAPDRQRGAPLAVHAAAAAVLDGGAVRRVPDAGAPGGLGGVDDAGQRGVQQGVRDDGHPTVSGPSTGDAPDQDLPVDADGSDLNAADEKAADAEAVDEDAFADGPSVEDAVAEDAVAEDAVAADAPDDEAVDADAAHDGAVDADASIADASEPRLNQAAPFDDDGPHAGDDEPDAGEPYDDRLHAGDDEPDAGEPYDDGLGVDETGVQDDDPPVSAHRAATVDAPAHEGQPDDLDEYGEMDEAVEPGQFDDDGAIEDDGPDGGLRAARTSGSSLRALATIDVAAQDQDDAFAPSSAPWAGRTWAAAEADEAEPEEDADDPPTRPDEAWTQGRGPRQADAAQGDAHLLAAVSAGLAQDDWEPEPSAPSAWDQPHGARPSGPAPVQVDPVPVAQAFPSLHMGRSSLRPSDDDLSDPADSISAAIPLKRSPLAAAAADWNAAEVPPTPRAVPAAQPLSPAHPEQPKWEGVRGVTGDMRREDELGAGKWTESARSLAELQVELATGPAREIEPLDDGKGSKVFLAIGLFATAGLVLWWVLAG